jgi:hypothetical protein
MDAVNKLIISYETSEGETRQEEYRNPPMFYDDHQYVLFAKGVLAEEEKAYSRIVEVYVTSIKYSAYEEGLKALAEADDA